VLSSRPPSCAHSRSIHILFTETGTTLSGLGRLDHSISIRALSRWSLRVGGSLEGLLRPPLRFASKSRWLRVNDGHAAHKRTRKITGWFPAEIGNCVGSQPILFAALAAGSVTTRGHAFQACSIDHSDISPFRINHLQAVWNSVAQNPPSNPAGPRCDLDSAVYRRTSP
jgi:hypothetical protein